jgi:RNA-directed DNA polymerase
MVNPVIRGWLQYYGQYSPSALYSFLARFNKRLEKWARRTYRLSSKRAKCWLTRISGRQPNLFVHWSLVSPAAG